jgi:hypothetical protein
LDENDASTARDGDRGGVCEDEGHFRVRGKFQQCGQQNEPTAKTIETN